MVCMIKINWNFQYFHLPQFLPKHYHIVLQILSRLFDNVHTHQRMHLCFRFAMWLTFLPRMYSLQRQASNNTFHYITQVTIYGFQDDIFQWTYPTFLQILLLLRNHKQHFLNRIWLNYIRLYPLNFSGVFFKICHKHHWCRAFGKTISITFFHGLVLICNYCIRRNSRHTYKPRLK